MHTHTHKPKQPKARRKDAPCDRMQPPGERKWLYPPKAVQLLQSDFATWFGDGLHCLIYKTQVLNKTHHYYYETEVLLVKFP